MKQLSQIDVDVQAYLDSLPVKYSVVYIGQTVWSDIIAVDKFSVSFTRNSSNVTFDFYQGIGHRAVGENKTILIEYTAAFRKLIDQQVRHTIDNSVFVFVPTSASVLYSLLSDSEVGQRTFPEFCHDFGYDEDSRKALDIYLACQNTSKQLNTIFKHGEISHLQTLLEDY